MKQNTKQKQAYLKYYERAKKKGTNKRNILTYGQWAKQQGTSGSSYGQGGVKSISDSDYKEIYNTYLRKK